MRSRLTLLLVSGLLCVSLTSCAARTSPIDAFLEPCVIEGNHASMKALMEDPISTNEDLAKFGGNAEDAVKRCNADKEAIKKAVGK